MGGISDVLSAIRLDLEVLTKKSIVVIVSHFPCHIKATTIKNTMYAYLNVVAWPKLWASGFSTAEFVLFCFVFFFLKHFTSLKKQLTFNISVTNVHIREPFTSFLQIKMMKRNARWNAAYDKRIKLYNKCWNSLSKEDAGKDTGLSKGCWNLVGPQSNKHNYLSV